MHIILVYDVNAKRVHKVLKTCRKYLISVQNSVFEGQLTDSKIDKLKNELSKIIIPSEDSICIYKYEQLSYVDKDQIGTTKEDNNII